MLNTTKLFKRIKYARYCSTNASNNATQSMVNMEEKVMKLFRTQNRIRFRMGLSVVAITGVTGLIFSDKIKNYFAGHTADVAAISLNDEDLQNKATTLSKEIVRQVLTDNETQNLTVSMLKQAIQHPDIRTQVKELVYEVLQDESVNKYTEDISERIVHKLLNDKGVQDHSEQFVSEVFQVIE